jgi:hypothetical protein
MSTVAAGIGPVRSLVDLLQGRHQVEKAAGSAIAEPGLGKLAAGDHLTEKARGLTMILDGIFPFF